MKLNRPKLLIKKIYLWISGGGMVSWISRNIKSQHVFVLVINIILVHNDGKADLFAKDLAI